MSTTSKASNLSVVTEETAIETTESNSAAEAGEYLDLDAPELYLNRELTWLEFNFRVLHEVVR